MSTAVPRLLPVLLATVALVAAGCGGGDGEDAAAPASPAPTASAAATAGDSGSGPGAGRAVDDDGDSGGEPQAQPAAEDLANFSCTQRKGGVWSASGDVTNGGSAAMVYTVTVATVDGAEVSGEETERLLLEAGESAGFRLPAISRGAADACMPRVLRAPR